MQTHARKQERSEVIIEYALTALSKLTVRYQGNKDQIKELIETYSDSIKIEIQQRACEYLQLFDPEWDNHRLGIFEPMPFSGTENMTVDANNRAVDDDGDDDEEPSPSQKRAMPPKKLKKDDDLIGDLLNTDVAVTNEAPATGGASGLEELMGLGLGAAPAQPAQPVSGLGGGLDDIFGSSTPVGQPA